MSSFFEQKYWSLEGQTVYISMDLESSLIACINGAGVTNATDLVLKNVRLIYDIFKMEPKAWDQIKKSYGNVIKYYGKEYLHRPESIPIGALSATVPLGWKKRYLTRIVACIRATVDIADPLTCSLSNRDQAYVQSYSLENDGTTVAGKEVFFKESCETYAEILKSRSGGIWNLHSDSLNIENSFDLFQPAGTTTDVGSFLMELDLQSLFSEDGQTLSGLDVYNSLQFVVKKSEGTDALETLDIFGEYWSEIVLNLNDGPNKGEFTCTDQ